MLIGDSIRLSYQNRVRELLQGQADVLSPAENCRFASYTLFSLATWAPDNDYDIVHWNNGQWDVCYMPDGRIHTPLRRYLDLQQRIADVLSRKAKRLIFATTTPVWPDMYDTAPRNPRKNKDIERYNARAAATLSAMGVTINDLYSPLAGDIQTYIGEDKVHLAPAGIETCARRVGEALMEKPL